MKRKYGLTFSEGKENVKIEKLHRPDKVKYTVYEAVKTVLEGCTSLTELAERLTGKEIVTAFVHRGGDLQKEIQDVTFTKDNLTFKASKIDRKFSYANLCKTIERNRFVANTAKKVMERTEIDGRRISEYLRQVEQIEQEKKKIVGQTLSIPLQTERQKCTPSTSVSEPITERETFNGYLVMDDNLTREWAYIGQDPNEW